MSESDLMNKFDAFIKKHHAAMVDEIPVLTDIVIEEEPSNKAENESAFQGNNSLVVAVNENDEAAVACTEEFTRSVADMDSLLQSGEDFPVIESSDIQTDFPVLVDVYEEPDMDVEPIPSTLTPIDIEPLDNVSLDNVSSGNVSRLSDEEAEQLARDIYIRVMSDIDGRVSKELRLEMSKRLSAMLDKTVSAAIEDFKQELANIVSDAISETLFQRFERQSKN